MKLENFQGIRTAEFRFNGGNARFFGDNSAGKTTAFNAYTWLLFGKASDNSPNFTPKPRKGDEDVHNVDTSVEMVFTHGGAEYTIARVFSEVWKKKRGSSKAEFGGHETTYFINGVPSRERDYNNFLNDIALPWQFMILTFPQYFSDELDWATRRKILFDACGNLSDADVIASNKELAPFPAILGDKTIDDLKKIVAAAMKRTNEELSGIPGRIDEATRAIPEVIGTVDEVKAAIAALEETKSAANQRRTDILNGGLLGSTLRKSISEKEAQLTEARSAHLRRNSEATEVIYTKLADARGKSSTCETRITTTRRTLERAESDLRDLMAKRDKIKADYALVHSETFDDGSTICPTCHREFPPEDVERIKAEYNIRKSERLTEILDGGKRNAGKELVAAKETEIAAAKTALDAAIAQFETAQAEVTTLNDELAGRTKGLIPFEETGEYDVLTGELNALKTQAADDKQAQTAAVAGVDAEISDINQKISAQYEILAVHNTAKAQRDRIDQLTAQEEKLGAEYVALEQQMYLCELFIKSKVAMLDEQINSKFKTVRFRLFTEQINGGLKECCDALIPTKEGNVVTWNGAANHAAKINAGLEIISTLSEHWGISVPVWFDNAESVTRLLSVPQQIITLSVREGEAKLRLERE
jgi:hypothetical protein